ncbi:MAG: hypothetical protein Wins2KO_19640 [Winogradskyella sp.]
MTANKVENSADSKPKTIPLIYLSSLFKINETPKTTTTPKIISYACILRLKKIGSINEAKKAPEENMASAIETFDCFIDSKKVTQCKAIIIPAAENCSTAFLETLILILVSFIKRNIKMAAITILYQTKGLEPMEIFFPKMAVKPAIKTSKCK